MSDVFFNIPFFKEVSQMQSVMQRIRIRHGHVTMAVVKRVPIPVTQWFENGLSTTKLDVSDYEKKK